MNHSITFNMPLPIPSTGATITYVQSRDPVWLHLGAEREEHLQAERVHDDDLCIVAIAEQTNVVAIRHVIGRHAGVHLG